MKIIIFGASGSGTTTLGKTVAVRLGYHHLDADSYYWKPTDPPFQEKIPFHARNESLKADYSSFNQVVISGSLVSWGDFWLTAFDLGIFLKIPSDVRMDRLKIREQERYGSTLFSNPETKAKSKDFLDWASKYDDPNFKGRSITHHQNWIKVLQCEVLVLDGNLNNEERLNLVKLKLTSMSSGYTDFEITCK